MVVAGGEGANAPLVSVVIACHNGADYLAETLRSVLAQTYRPIEVIVVDDASTDGSGEVALGFGFPVRVIRNAERKERSYSRNLGVTEAKGQFIAFNDADDLWDPEKLEVQVATLLANPDCALVYSRARSVRMEDGGWRRDPEWGGACSGMRADRFLVRENAIGLLTVVMRRECFLKVGGFDSTAWVQGCEDYDLWLRVAGCAPILFLDAALATYRLHAAQTSANKRRMAIRAARVRWRYMARRPDVLAGKDVLEQWRDRYGELDTFALQSLDMNRYADAIIVACLLLMKNPLERAWYRVLGRAVRRGFRQ